MKIAMLIRGHVRKALDNPKLQNYINVVSDKYKVDLYLSTWDKTDATESPAWHSHKKKKNKLLTDVSYNYLDQYFSLCNVNLIKTLIVSESDIKLSGRDFGKVGKASLKNWKKMWYGIYHGVNLIDTSKYDLIINTRYDINELDRDNSWKPKYYINPTEAIQKTVGCIDAFVKHNAWGAKILFATGYESSKYQGRLQMSNGCDNLYVGTPLDMKYVVTQFHFNLDEIISTNSVSNHEKLLCCVCNNLGINKIKKAEEYTI